MRNEAPQLGLEFEKSLEAALRAPSGPRILLECLNIAQMLCEKNTLYGDSALRPLRVFSRSSPTEQIRVRIDDKLSRLANAVQDTEDTLSDLVGYLVLLRIGEQGAKIPDRHPAPVDGGPRN